MEVLFVYGTLRSGGSNHFRLRDAKLLGTGVVAGRLYRVDWYPALILDSDGEPVVGDLVEIPSEHLAALDGYEGREYRRVRAAIMPTNGTGPQDAWLWEYVDPVDESRRIDGGDWLAVAEDL